MPPSPTPEGELGPRSVSTPGPEKVEGLGDPADASWGDYPIDTLFIRSDTRTVHDVLRRIEKGGFIMNPDFQRDFIWPEDKQSRLIESVVMRIPLPVIYLAEDDRGRTIVVDGLQRLRTFERFVHNELRLSLPDRPELHQKRFRDLGPKLQNRVEDCSLILYIIDAKVPERARLDIFERVNGGVPLSRQQMRNCLFTGPAASFLKEESRTEVFLDATGRSLRTDTMRDREFINRYCAFDLLAPTDYRDMDDWLAAALRTMNTNPDRLPALSDRFRTSLRNNHDLFGCHAFRKHTPDQESRNPINASLWDVMTTGLSRYSALEVQGRANDLRERFFRLLGDSDFNDAITYGPNSVKKVRRRFEMAHEMFVEVFGAH